MGKQKELFAQQRIIVLLARHHLPSVIAALRLAPAPSQLTEGGQAYILSGHTIGRTEMVHFNVFSLFVNNPRNELCFSDSWVPCYCPETIWDSA